MDVQSGRLTGPDGEVVLRRQAWSLLRELVEHAPGLIARNELLDRVWGREALSPNALPQTISEIRQALGDSARQPRYIETVRGRGYRMACSVVADDSLHCAQAAHAKRLPGRRRRWSAAAATVLTGLGLLAWAGWAWLGHDDESGQSLAASADPASADGDMSASQRLRRQAEQARAEHDVLAAAAHWRALAAIHPRLPDVLIELARAELDALQGDRAREALARLQRLPSGDSDPHARLLAAELAILDGDLDAATAGIDRLLAQAASAGDSDLAVSAAMLLADLGRRDGNLSAVRSRLQTMSDDHRWNLDPQQRGRLLLEAMKLAQEEGQLGLSGELADALQALTPDRALGQRLRIQRAMLDIRNGRAGDAWHKLEVLADAGDRIRSPEFEITLENARGLAAIETGRLKAAQQHFDRAHKLARASGNALRSAGLQVNAALALARQGRLEEADALWVRALEVFEAAGDRRGQATCLGNLAASASTRGLNERSREFNEKALALFRALALDADRARTAFNLALLASRSGRLDDAESLLAEAEAVYRDRHDHELTLHIGSYRARQRILAGDYELARQLVWDLAPILGNGSFMRQASYHDAVGKLALVDSDLAAARNAFDQALTLRRQAGQEDWARAAELDLLRVDLLVGTDLARIHVEAAERARYFADAGHARDAVAAWLLAAEALLSQGDRVQARHLLERASEQVRSFDDLATTLEIDWVSAWAAPDAERVPRLQSLADKARQRGFGLYEQRVMASLSPGPGAALPANGSVATTGAISIALPPYAAPERTGGQ